MIDAKAAALLRFWFGAIPPTPESVAATRSLWFEATPAFDDELRARFGSLVASARSGALVAWEAQSRGALALVLALDQLPRNLWRGSAEAFASDALALAVAERALARGDLSTLTPIEQAFLLLPFEHAESLEAQETCVRRLDALLADAPATWRALLADWAPFARQHREIVARFGRFPHRNAVLGRASTAEEQAFLAAGAASFGQPSS